MSTFKLWNVWNVNGDIIFKGTAEFGVGSRIFVGEQGKLQFGNNFLVTANAEIACAKDIVFGDDVLLSWDILIMDTDSHSIRNAAGFVINPDKPIVIGDNVWIGARSIILKGSKIPENSVVGACALVAGDQFRQEKVIIEENPATINKEGIIWDRDTQG